MKKISIVFVISTFIFFVSTVICNAQMRSTWVTVAMISDYKPSIMLTSKNEYTGQKLLFEAITIEDKNLPGIKWDYNIKTLM